MFLISTCREEKKIVGDLLWCLIIILRCHVILLRYWIVIIPRPRCLLDAFIIYEWIDGLLLFGQLWRAWGDSEHVWFKRGCLV